MAYAPQMNESAYRGEQVSPASGRRAAYRTKPCRYHQAGYCKDGRACPFRHEEDTQGARLIFRVYCSFYSNLVSDMELRKSSIGRVPNVPQSSARGKFVFPDSAPIGTPNSDNHPILQRGPRFPYHRMRILLNQCIRACTLRQQLLGSVHQDLRLTWCPANTLTLSSA